MRRKPNLIVRSGWTRLWITIALLCSVMLSHAGCFLRERVEPYYSRVAVPATQEFRWSDGGLPQNFDPAFAAAPPDTDLVRAIFEGLTDYDARTLAPIPAVATRWEPSNNGLVWTFYLRQDARWSNGESVVADDFVRSWQRTLKIGDLAPHTELLDNIEGTTAEKSPKASASPSPEMAKGTNDRKFGAVAVSDRVLRVRLRRPDMNFPALVAHPVFRPVKVTDEQSTGKLAASGLVSNGAFSLAKNAGERVLLERAENYWDKAQVTLDRVEFVGEKDVESALAAYREGKVDAVTNAPLEPLAIKLLRPYDDFRHTTYGALTYYTFNRAHEPFDDVRVREALALAIDRERISADHMGGATQPAKRFLPDAVGELPKPVVGKSELLETDPKRAKELLAEAGFPDGEGFPKVRLLINRNEQQRGVAQAVAAMWRRELNIETEIIVKPWDEYEAAIRSGEFDVVRRGLVLQTTDEMTNMRIIFGDSGSSVSETTTIQPDSNAAAPASGNAAGAPQTNESGATTPQPIETEAQGLNDLTAMPIYFASSFSLVKPYVVGFDSNVLDAPSLKTVRINTSWKPSESQPATWVK